MSEMMHVPDGWEMKKLSEIGEIITGNTPPTDNQEYYNGNIPFIGPSDLGKEKYILKSEKTLTNEGFEQTRKLPKNSILVTCIGELGKIGISKLELATNQQINSLVCNKKFDTEFVYYALSADIKFQMQKEAGLQVVPIVNKSSFSKLNLIIPKEKKEQEKIAKILSTLDKSIESTNSLIEKEKNIKTALMQELLTNGIDQNGQIRTKATHTYKPSELGLIPDEWEVVSLKDVMTIQYGKDQKEVEVENGKYPILGSGGVIGYTNHCLYDKPSVLIGRKGTIDNPQYMETPFWTVDTLFYSHIKSNSFPKWVFYTFQTINWRAYNEASGVPSLSTSNINSVKIKKPPKEEQKQIAKILTTQDKKIETEETNLAKLKELKKGLMNDLLSGKVRVKV